MHRIALALACVLLVALTGTNGQTCGATLQLENDDIVINPDETTTCIQCIVFDVVQNVVQWSASSVSLVDGENGVNIVNGVLVVTNATAFVGAYGGVPVDLECSAAGGSQRERVYLEGLFEPTATATNNGVVVEGGSITIMCANTNAPDTTRLQWVAPNPARDIQPFPSNLLMDMQRVDAGTYECKLNSTADGRVVSDTVNIAVQYPPSVGSDDVSPVFVPLDRRLTLSCTYDSVPDSEVTWAQDGNMITSGVNGYILANNPPTSVLTLTDVNRDSGGTYTCTADNTIGSSATASVIVTVQVPPDAATDLTVSNEQETSIDLAWMNNFNGFSPITGVNITATPMGDSTPESEVGLVGDATLQATTISDLTPFTTYTFELRVRNDIGLSEPITMTGRTLSLRLEAPVMVTLVSPTSTSLLLDWEAPPSLATTEAPQNWTLELLDSDGNGLMAPTVQDPGTTEYTFNDLDKGVSYGARVAGVNVRGIGDYSEVVMNQTLVDPPSMPVNLTGEGVSAFGFELSWEAPADNGGRPITEYIVSYSVQGMDMFNNVSTMTELELLLRNGGDPSPPLDLVNSTTYDIRVWAINEAGMGDIAAITVATQSIEEPQRIFEPPVAAGATNLTVVISWEFPGGLVDNFIVEFKLRSADWTNPANVMTVTVPGNQTSVTLSDLRPAASYDVRVRSQNALGLSDFSFEAVFMTLAPDPPTVSGPAESPAGEMVQINCSSPIDIFNITWFRRGTGSDGLANLPATVNQVGNNLVFTEPTVMDTGPYVCRLGSVVQTEHVITFRAQPSPPAGISTEVIIIVSVVGGVAVLVFLGVLLVACCFTCCSSSSKKKSSYSVKSKSQAKSKSKSKGGKGKKSMTWIETSTKFVPNTNPNYSRDPAEPSPFDMPDDLTTHSSFNTLEKQNRIRQGSDPPPNYGNSNV